MCLSLFLMNMTKISYHNPRPYWVDIAVIPYGSCSQEFGNASGHSIFVCSFMFYFLDVFHGTLKGKKIAWYIYFPCLLFTLGFIVCMGYARLYVGLHTLNQIIYGW